MSKWRLKLLQRLTILMRSSTNGSAERSNKELTEKCKNDSTKRIKNGLRRRKNLLQSPKWLDLPKRKGFATFLEIRFSGMTAITMLVAAITIGVSFGLIRSNTSPGTCAIKGSTQSPTATPAKGQHLCQQQNWQLCHSCEAMSEWRLNLTPFTTLATSDVS